MMRQKRIWMAAGVFLAIMAVPVLTAEARCYHPTMGRWVQRDPAGYAAGMNAYGYADASPVHFVDSTGWAPQPTASPPQAGKPYSVTEGGKKYDGTLFTPAAKDPWAKIAAGTLAECPAQLTLPNALESKLAASLTRTIAEHEEYGGIITTEAGDIAVWDPHKGTTEKNGLKYVVVEESAPPSRSETKVYMGYYHTHDKESSQIEGMPEMTETRFSYKNDIKYWFSYNQVAIVRNCRCTYALVWTTAYANTKGNDEVDFTKAAEQFASPIPGKEYSGELTPQAQWQKKQALMEAKQKTFGAAALKIGACYYRRCGEGPNKGQQTLDLVTGK
jgi:hypothetical protein